MILGLLVGAAAAADVPAAWNSLTDATMTEAVGGSPDIALRYCAAALDDVAADDAARGDLLYCVARNQLRLGDVNAAAGSLNAVPASSPAWGPARTLLDRLHLEARALPALPARCGFERDACGFVRGWEMLEKGVLEAREVGEDSVLAWDTMVRDAEGDRISVAFQAGVEVREIRFRVRSTRFPADIRVYLVEGSGARFLSPILEVPVDGWREVELDAAAFRPVDGAGAQVAPRSTRLVEFVDLTGTLLTDRGANTLLFDDLAVR